MLQVAACTFDAHLQEIVGALLFGSTVAMLHPNGNIDLVYLSQILHRKQISYILAVPSFLHHLYYFIHQQNNSASMTIQTICCIGEDE